MKDNVVSRDKQLKAFYKALSTETMVCSQCGSRCLPAWHDGVQQRNWDNYELVNKEQCGVRFHWNNDLQLVWVTLFTYMT